MLQEEHSAILSIFIKLPFVLSIFEWPFFTGFTVYYSIQHKILHISHSRFLTFCVLSILVHWNTIDMYRNIYIYKGYVKHYKVTVKLMRISQTL